jgi:hypothetical protein
MAPANLEGQVYSKITALYILQFWTAKVRKKDTDSKRQKARLA